MYDRILIATDGSKLSQKAVAHGLRLARATDAEVVALHVVPRYPQSYFEGSIALDSADVKRIEAQWRERGEAVVDDVIRQATALKVRVKPVITVATSVADAVIKAATRHRCDLVVMASHGRRGVARVLLGSEAQHVLTHSMVPVLVIR